MTEEERKLSIELTEQMARILLHNKVVVIEVAIANLLAGYAITIDQFCPVKESIDAVASFAMEIIEVNKDFPPMVIS